MLQNSYFLRERGVCVWWGAASRSSAQLISESVSFLEFLNFLGGGWEQGRECHGELVATDFWAVFFHF